MKLMLVLFLLLLIGWLSYPLITNAKEIIEGPVNAALVKVVDGDTLEVEAHIWLGQKVNIKVRLYGIDTPEKRGKCSAEREKALEAQSFVQDTLKGQKTVILHNIMHDKYSGRIVAVVETSSYTDLGQELIKRGLARKYFGATKSSWCQKESKNSE